MCMHRVWSTHGFGECMGSVGRMVWVNVWGWTWLKKEQVFENGKMWLAADGSLWWSSLADAPMVLREEWRSEASFSGAALSCCTLCILACAACRTHLFSVCRWLEIWVVDRRDSTTCDWKEQSYLSIMHCRDRHTAPRPPLQQQVSLTPPWKDQQSVVPRFILLRTRPARWVSIRTRISNLQRRKESTGDGERLRRYLKRRIQNWSAGANAIGRACRMHAVEISCVLVPNLPCTRTQFTCTW